MTTYTIHTRWKDVLLLEEIFATPSAVEEGQLVWTTPDWIELLFTCACTNP